MEEPDKFAFEDERPEEDGSEIDRAGAEVEPE